MDKIAANNLFVTLRKEVKKAKAMVSGNLIRKIAKYKKEKEKLEDADQASKIDNKIAAILDDIKLLKTLEVYNISKQAILKPNLEHWNRIISHTKASTEEKLSARVIVKNNVQKHVKKFREDHTDCDEWLNEYIEYREKKREIVSGPTKPFKKKTDSSQHRKEVKKLGNRKENKFGRKPIDNGGGKERLKQQDNKQFEKKKHSDESAVEEPLHPSWQVKRKQKELLKSALSGDLKKAKAIKFVAG